MASLVKPESKPRSFPVAGVLLLILIPIIILAAFGLRVRDLGVQSLWFDEAMSVVFGTKSPPELMALAITEDIHPPLYLLLLHYWMVLAGDGEFSARFLSVIAGIPLVPLMYITGKRLDALANQPLRPSTSSDPAGQGLVPRRSTATSTTFSLVGFIAAVLAASSAFYIGYSQEARNYMLVTFLGLLSSYLLLRALGAANRRPWIMYAVVTLAALYTNYTAFLLLLFQAVFVLLLRRSIPGLMRRWLSWFGLLALAYAPWAGYAVDQLFRINDYWPGTLLVGDAVSATLAEFVAGGGAQAAAVVVPMALGVVVLLVGALVLVTASRRSRSQHSTFLLLYLVIPTVTLFAIAYSRPKFDPRYLLVATPAFYLTIAWGLTALIRAGRSRLPLIARIALPMVGILALGGIVVASAVYGDPTQEKADYRGLVAYIDAHAQPGDAVVLLMNAPEPYIYYSKKGVPWYPMERVDNFRDAITRLNKLAANHRRLWFLLWQDDWEDPAGYVLHIMSTQATEEPLNVKFTGLGLRLFDVSPTQPFSYYPIIQHPIDATFGGSLEFWGWNAESEAVPAGKAFNLDLHWITHKKQTTDLKEAITLVDADHHVWARTDEVMVNPLYPPTKWNVGDIIHDVHKLQVPAGTPPGDYTIEMNLYDPATLKELSIATTSHHTPIGTVLTLGKVSVTPSTGYSPPPAGEGAKAGSTASQLPQGSWELGSDSLNLLSSKVSQTKAVPGDRLEITAKWQVPQTPKSDYSVRIALFDGTGQPLGEQTMPLSPYPTSKWRSGEQITSKYWFSLPLNLDERTYWISIAPVSAEPGTQSSEPGTQNPARSPTPPVSPSPTRPISPLRYTQIAMVDVKTPDANYNLPHMENTLGATIGGKADLAGFDLSATTVRPGDTLHLTIYWKTVSRFDKSYKVFTHVINDQNVFAGQHDSIPVNNTRPTTTWRSGEVVTDKYDIPIASDAKPGTYMLKVGMYSANTGDRLQIVGADGAPRGDSVALATIEVAP